MSALQLTISGIYVTLTTGSPGLAAIFAEYFRYHISSHPDLSTSQAEHPRIEIELIPVAVLPDRGSFLHSGAEQVSRTGQVELWRKETPDEDLFFFLTPGASYEIQPLEGRIRGFVAPDGIGSPHILANTWTLFPLLLALRSRGRYHLHAAAVLSPQNELWLICGPQRSGKTTLATALGLAGWSPIADDSVILREHGRGLSIEPLRKRFHVSRDLFELWSEHSPGREAAVYGDRFCLDGLERFSSLAAADQSYDRVYGIVLPEINGQQLSQLRPASIGEGLIGLAEESTFFPIWSDHVRRHWELLSLAALRARSFRLSAGRDILDDPRRAADLLN
ncbi:MAG: hypothetical protein IPM55_18345 [Acidobacteria bacterium]|nr:hypothetical protein [Acidobacteriota bacterium]